MPAAVLEARTKCSPVSKQHIARKAAQEKWERNVFTPTGQKVTRIQPSINNDSLSKYQNRGESSSNLERDSYSHRSSTPITRPRTTGSFPISSAPHSGVTAEGRPKTPFTIYRRRDSASSEGSNDRTERRGSAERYERPNTAHSLTYSIRSSVCTPPHLYSQDKLRQALKEAQPSGHAKVCEYASRNQPKRQEKIPRRFGKPIHLPGFVKGNEFLTHSDLSLGQKQYIWGIAQVYSVTDLKILKQRQYQTLLDYEFTRRLQNKELSERKRIREIKEYMKYTKFIQTYEQRIPRLLRAHNETYAPCKELHHIHKHALTGWTTQSTSQPESTYSSSDYKFSEEKFKSAGRGSEKGVESSTDVEDLKTEPTRRTEEKLSESDSDSDEKKEGRDKEEDTSRVSIKEKEENDKASFYEENLTNNNDRLEENFV